MAVNNEATCVWFPILTVCIGPVAGCVGRAGAASDACDVCSSCDTGSGDCANGVVLAGSTMLCCCWSGCCVATIVRAV
jgi:hypothetical protein